MHKDLEVVLGGEVGSKWDVSPGSPPGSWLEVLQLAVCEGGAEERQPITGIRSSLGGDPRGNVCWLCGIQQMCHHTFQSCYLPRQHLAGRFRWEG